MDTITKRNPSIVNTLLILLLHITQAHIDLNQWKKCTHVESFNPLVLTLNTWTFGKLSLEEWKRNHCSRVVWSLHFAKTYQMPTIPNHVTSTATFLMVADAQGLSQNISANPS